MAYDVLGNPVRAQLYAYIQENPGLFFGEIYEGFRSTAQEITGQNFPAQSLVRHLARMRDAGVIATDLPENRRVRGRAARYYPQPEATDAIIDALIERINAFRSRSD